jgi:Tol biopolymer transport system component
MKRRISSARQLAAGMPPSPARWEARLHRGGRHPACRLSRHPCRVILLVICCTWASFAANPETAPDVRALAAEVTRKGWILFTAKTPQGDYDLFLSRPDGSVKRNITQTPDWSEYGGRFSPDSKHMLYRRQKAGEAINHDRWGAMGMLVVANADGSNPVVQGGDGEWPWASWSPDGKLFACLYKREGVIRIIHAETKTVFQELPRQGIFQQMFWSPDGKRLVGTANFSGQDWNILSIELETGKSTLLSRALNCTPDWFQGDPNRVIYSNRTPALGNKNGWTMLMQATADGKSRTLVYGERDRHIYYGGTSPDDKYVIFSVPPTDGGVDAEMALVRLADTPMIVPSDYTALKALYPGAKHGPVLHLGEAGFEPHWTYADVGGK